MQISLKDLSVPLVASFYRKRRFWIFNDLFSPVHVENKITLLAITLKL